MPYKATVYLLDPEGKCIHQARKVFNTYGEYLQDKMVSLGNADLIDLEDAFILRERNHRNPLFVLETCEYEED